MDLEGFASRRVLSGYSEEAIINGLSRMIAEFKEWDSERRREFSTAVLEEVVASQRYTELKDAFLKRLLSYPRAGVTMGEFGVGSRGEGDFFVHRGLAEIIGETGAVVDSRDQDDAGVVEGRGYITLAVDGMHSRLSEFPFLAGFHAARACARDIFVMGSRPRGLISDMHLGDDGDVGKLFDYTAGAAAVGELIGAPLVAGSTLRIGGDMVLGDRFVGAVGAIGTSPELPRARRNAEVGDVMLATQGSGGGTITTIAIYNGRFDVLKETLNVEFMHACDALMGRGLLGEVNALSDVTNGGLRGDAWEIARTSGRKLVLHESELEKTVEPRVLRMLEELEIDPMGVSTDSLLLILPEGSVKEVKGALRGTSEVHEIGRVEEGEGAHIESEGAMTPFKPLFRESAYTRLKKVVGEGAPKDIKALRGNIDDAKEKAMAKKDEVLRLLRGG
ncbi:MAG: AIR synthase-related protein [Candidatus Hydrothermarchaeaceae archaeon]